MLYASNCCGFFSFERRPAEELYDIASDPEEQRNLVVDPEQEARKKDRRAELEAWTKQQGDQRIVYGTPRLLSDPTSYGPGAVPLEKLK